MFKKALQVLILAVLVNFNLNADDFLSSITNGVVSDKSLGVKVLNTEDMNKIVGGYYYFREAYPLNSGIPVTRSYIVAELVNINGGIYADYDKPSSYFNLPENEILVLQDRFTNRYNGVYLLAINMDTLQGRLLEPTYKYQEIVNDYINRIGIF